MTTKAEELARHLAEAMAIPKEVAIIQQHIEKYGRLVQEAAALIVAEGHSPGETIRRIREMPLP
jgi:antitoxin component HigA of HigAB toxin-antitoxin module